MKRFLYRIRDNTKGVEVLNVMILVVFTITLSGIVLAAFGDVLGEKISNLGKDIANIFDYTTGDSGEDDFEVDDVLLEKVLYALDSEKLGGKTPDYYGLATNEISRYTHSRSNSIHTLTGSGDNIVFTATADWVEGDSLMINNKPAYVKSLLNERLEGEKLFKTGAEVRLSARYNSSDNSYDCFMEHLIKDYSITYNLNSGAFSSTPKYSYTSRSDTYTLLTPTRSGYIFQGWTGSNGSTANKNVSIAQGSSGNKTYTANWLTDKKPITFSSSNITTKVGNISNAGVGAQSITFGIADGGSSWNNIYLAQTIDTKNYSKLVIGGYYSEGGSDSKGFIVVSTSGGEIHRQECNAAKGTTINLAKTVDVSKYDSVTFIAQLYVSGTGSWRDWAQLVVNSCYLTN